MKNENKINLRIVFSALALLSFLLFSLCNNLMVEEYTSYCTYGWRFRVLNDLFLSVPFILLFTFSLMEQQMKHINQRIFVFGIFFMYFIQTILFLLSSSVRDFSFLCCNLFGQSLYFVLALLAARLIFLILIPRAHKSLLKFYSVGMIILLAIALIAVLSTEYFYVRYSVTKTVINLSIDILFHIALFFFSDLLKKENEKPSWRDFLNTLIPPSFANLFDNGDYFSDEKISEESTEKPQIKETDYATEYKKVLIHAINEEDYEFLTVNSFFLDLSREIVTNDENKYYPTEKYIQQLTCLAQKINAINSEKPECISSPFSEHINALIEKKDKERFKTDVISTAKKMFGEKTVTWEKATQLYFEGG